MDLKDWKELVKPLSERITEIEEKDDDAAIVIIKGGDDDSAISTCAGKSHQLVAMVMLLCDIHPEIKAGLFEVWGFEIAVKSVQNAKRLLLQTMASAEGPKDTTQ